MKIMVSFELTEDYIIEVESESEALKTVQEIFDFKQNSQNDLLLQNNIRYSCDIDKKYFNVEDQEEDGVELDYKITYVERAASPEKALESLTHRIVGITDYIEPEISPVENLEYEDLTGIKAEGTD